LFENPVAWKVKRADIEDNADEARPALLHRTMPLDYRTSTGRPACSMICLFTLTCWRRWPTIVMADIGIS
jgi:hypothetical protein